MAKGLARDNYRFVNSPIGLELAICIAIVAVVLGAIAVRLFVFG